MPQDWKEILSERFGAVLPDAEETASQPEEKPRPKKQRLIVAIDRRGRAGKQVTRVSGFSGDDVELESLCRQLKTRLGTGGSVKDGEMVIQGDVRDKVVAWLTEMGHQAKRGN